MSTRLIIDYVSDIACAWCVVGLYSLERALRAFPDVEPEFRFHPFELDASIGMEGENLLDHIADKYEIPAEEVREGLAALTARGAEVGFAFNFSDASRVWNTFDAHRLLHWSADPAGLKGPAGSKVQGGSAGPGGLADKTLALEKALYAAYFTDNRNVADIAVLADAARKAGLDGDAAVTVLESGAYRDDVRQAMRVWRERGVTAVPTIRLQDKLTITCAQTVQAFERSIRAALQGAGVSL